eukprot:6487461-Amphidinium_carterae.4
MSYVSIPSMKGLTGTSTDCGNQRMWYCMRSVGSDTCSPVVVPIALACNLGQFLGRDAAHVDFHDNLCVSDIGRASAGAEVYSPTIKLLGMLSH